MTNHRDDDVVAGLDELRRERNRKLNTPLVFMFIHSAVSILALLAIFLYLRTPVNDTNDAVRREVPRLERRVAELEADLTDAETVIDQAVKAILEQCELLTANDIECPQVILDPDKESDG